MTPPSGLPRVPIGFAHRGARSERRENTLDAFSRALELGANGLESDAWITADGVVVLDHDGVIGSLWRRRPISTQSRSDLPDHIPSLEELFQECGTDFELSLDIKDPASLESVMRIAGAAGATGKLWLCYQDWRLMAAWKGVTAGAHLVESTHTNWMSEGLGPRAAALDAAGIHAINLHGSDWNAERLKEVHQAGLLGFGWDAQSKAEILRLLDLGLDGLYSDHVDRMVAAIRSRSGA
jgi:glycerophosphoryl diester phosphodiesterase